MKRHGTMSYLFFRNYPSAYAGTHTIRPFTYHTNPLNPDTDEDGQNDYNDPVPLDYDMDGDGYINDGGLVFSGWSTYVERLAIAANNDPNILHWPSDNDMDDDGLPWNLDPDDDADGMSDDYEKKYGSAAVAANIVNGQGWQHPYIYNARYAVLVGGSDCACENDLIEMYDKLIGYNYLDENTYCLLWNKPAGYANGRVDGSATLTDMTYAFSQIGSKITKNDFFYFSEIGHGAGFSQEENGYFALVGGEGNCYFGHNDSNFNLSGLLDTTIESYARSLFVMSSCGCGYALEQLWKSDRIIITAASTCDWESAHCAGKDTDTFHTLDDDTHWAFLWKGRWQITAAGQVWDQGVYWGFIPNLGSIESPQPIKYAFDKGVEAAQYNYRQDLGGGIVVDARSTPAALYCSPANPTYTYL